MSRRGPYAKGLAKREEILDIALELVAQKGYDRTSVREIARKAGLSQAGLLHYFSTKEELFLELLRRRDDRVTEPAEETHRHSVGRLIRAVERNSREPGLVQLYVALSAENATESGEVREFFQDRYEWLLAQVSEDVRERQISGEVTTTRTAEDIASLLVAAADGLQLQWLLNSDEVDMTERLSLLWESLKNSK